ncbi:MAG: ribosome biogenesis GTPase Der [Deltaproteobacteria bacterium]|nr:ribosome biogenesis GTPase Der [Deltaproteobacteria bacterium]MBW2362207.1 ribosome biogenesis GTPase Der [Deltaproteobacteria bacterium]
MSHGQALPIVAIVGRPNVGKSTLFNRFARRRRALVHNEPGITRDRVAEEIEVEGRRILLVDTAGLNLAAAAAIDRAVQAQVRAALDEADAILFVVDGRAGRLPEDEAVARMLYRGEQPISLLVNKLDIPRHDIHLSDFLGLGFERAHAVSAEHGRGAWDALEELIVQLPAALETPAEAETGLRVALVGRPNVGKSSLLNRLCGQDRVVVSDEPGTTRDAVDTTVEWEGARYTLVDTAGLRRSGRRDRTAEPGSALMTVRSLERADVALIVLDASEGPTEQDARVASLARERGCAVVVLANKWDLVDAERSSRLHEEVAQVLRFLSDAPVLQVSAKTGAGLGRKLFRAVEDVARAGALRVSTAALNRWMERTVARHEPAMAQRGARKKPVKFQYATQVGVRPPTFVLFCTAPEAVQESYRRFLENRLREDFELRGTPVRLRLRARARD